MKRTAVVLLFVMLPAALLHAQRGEEDRRFKLAQGYESSGDYKNAARVYKELYDQDPGSNAYFDGLRRTYMAMLQYAELLPLAEARVRKQPREIDLRALYANLLHRKGKREEGLEQWRTAMETRPEDAMTYDVVAQSQIEIKLYHNAIETYRQGRSAIHEPGAFAEQLAALYGATGQYENATAEYLLLLDAGDFNKGLVMGGLGLFTTNPDGADAAITVVKGRLGSRADHIPYLELLSWLYTERGDYNGAFEMAKTLDRLRGGRGSDIYAFADRALRERRYESAIQALDYFRNNYPRDNPIYGNVLLSYTRALEGRYREGAPSSSSATELIEQYRSVVRENKGSVPAAEALLRMAHLQADDLNEPEDAIETIEEIRSDYPKFASLPEALLLQGDLHLWLGDIAKAGELYDAAARSITASSMDGERYRDESALRRAEVLFHTGSFGKAEDAFNELTLNISSPVANDALAYLFLLQENMGKNDSALLQYARGTLLMRQHKWKDAIETMDRVVTLGSGSTLVDEALYHKARAQDAQGDNAGAVTTLLALVQDHSDGTMADRALYRAAELAEQRLHDTPKAIELYTRLLTEYPMSTQANSARARIRNLRGDS